MDVLNMNPHTLPVKLKAADGSTDYATVAARRRVTLPKGVIVDTNWLAQQKMVKTFDSSTSKIPLVLQQAANIPVPAPAPANNDTKAD